MDSVLTQPNQSKNYEKTYKGEMEDLLVIHLHNTLEKTYQEKYNANKYPSQV